MTWDQKTYCRGRLQLDTGKFTDKKAIIVCHGEKSTCLITPHTMSWKEKGHLRFRTFCLVNTRRGVIHQKWHWQKCACSVACLPHWLSHNCWQTVQKRLRAFWVRHAGCGIKHHKRRWQKCVQQPAAKLVRKNAMVYYSPEWNHKWI